MLVCELKLTFIYYSLNTISGSALRGGRSHVLKIGGLQPGIYKFGSLVFSFHTRSLSFGILQRSIVLLKSQLIE